MRVIIDWLSKLFLLCAGTFVIGYLAVPMLFKQFFQCVRASENAYAQMPFRELCEMDRPLKVLSMALSDEVYLGLLFLALCGSIALLLGIPQKLAWLRDVSLGLFTISIICATFQIFARRTLAASDWTAAHKSPDMLAIVQWERKAQSFSATTAAPSKNQSK